MITVSDCTVFIVHNAVACATQSTTSSLPVNLEQLNEKPANYYSGPSLKQTCMSDVEAVKQSDSSCTSRQYSAEEIERKKQEALRRRQGRALTLKM